MGCFVPFAFIRAYPQCKRFISSPLAKVLSSNLRKSEKSVDNFSSFYPLRQRRPSESRERWSCDAFDRMAGRARETDFIHRFRRFTQIYADLVSVQPDASALPE